MSRHYAPLQRNLLKRGEAGPPGTGLLICPRPDTANRGRQRRRNPRGRNTRNEAQPSPAPQGEAQPGRGVGAAGPAGHVLERTGAPELWKRRRPPSPPSRGRPDQGLHSPLRRPNPGRSQATAAIPPGLPAPAWPGGVLMKETPHRSGEHGRPQRPRTHSCGNTGLPGGFPAPQGLRGMRLRSPAARGPGRETRRHLVRDETGAIREPRRPHRLDHPDHPGRVPLHPASRTRRRFRQAPGPAGAGPGGDMDRRVNRPIFT